MQIRIFLILLFSACLTKARAQYVSIPDTSFGGWLYHNGFSTCMTGSSSSGWQLDTSCSAVQSDTLMVLNDRNAIPSLSGVQYFRALKYLDCSVDYVASIPALPPGLVTLLCGHNMLTLLPTLPASLRTLDCSLNRLSSLPTLPSLTYLNCSENNLYHLPALPASLSYLNCSNDSLPILPGPLPPLVNLICSQNLLSSLPALPSSLDSLDCSNNLFTALPSLPSGLLLLNCYFNYLPAMPALPSGLAYLDCHGNGLDSLDALPASVDWLDCSQNNLRMLPALPALLSFLNCGSNQLSSLPALPDSLGYLDCHSNANLQCLPHLGIVVNLNLMNTAVSCLPDSPAGNLFMIPQLPVCSGPCVAGISEASSDSWKVWPNPAVSTVKITGAPAIKQLQISDLSGRQLMEIGGDGRNSMEIDIQSLPAGTYLLVLKTEGGTVCRRLAVQTH